MDTKTHYFLKKAEFEPMLATPSNAAIGHIHQGTGKCHTQLAIYRITIIYSSALRVSGLTAQPCRKLPSRPGYLMKQGVIFRVT
jgi:hypothetical protein